MKQNRQRIEFGDWQTPPALAAALLHRVSKELGGPIRTIVEPTCGIGNFLDAASTIFPKAQLFGYEINAEYARRAKERVAGAISCQDFFKVDWLTELSARRDPILICGNPPWVTSSALGCFGGANLPNKENIRKLPGMDALTGAGNFDISEAVIMTLMHSAQPSKAFLSFICKTSVARRVLQYAAQQELNFRGIGLWRVDAHASFGAAVDACFFAFSTDGQEYSVPIYRNTEATVAAGLLAIEDGQLVADGAAYRSTRHLAGICDPEWRSGIKHDCIQVMEISRDSVGFVNGLGDRLDIEDDRIFALAKGSDLAAGRRPSGDRWVVVPQLRLGEDTLRLREKLPRTWGYLSRYGDRLDARRSSIYRNRARFAVFGVGEYTFAPWKVAICGLGKRLNFSVLGPNCGRPILLDDTCYFLPFDHQDAAVRALAVLMSPEVQQFYAARVFWDAKRPITKAVLQALDLAALTVK